jgi:hypothetical protein
MYSLYTHGHSIAGEWTHIFLSSADMAGILKNKGKKMEK